MTLNPPNAHKMSLIKRYPLLTFFGLAYWLFLAAIIFIGATMNVVRITDPSMQLLIALASWTPNAAAVIVVWAHEKRDGIRKLLSGWLSWRVNIGWYLAGLFPFAAAFLVVGITALLKNQAIRIGSPIPAAALAAMVIFNLIQGATGEELGWRGFALPGLQKRHSPLISAVILGVLISGWHSLLHLASPTGVPEWQFWTIMICYSVIAAWLYNRSGRSLVIITLLHFAFNFSLQLATTGWGLTGIGEIFTGYVIIYFAAAAGVVLLDRKFFFLKPQKANQD